MLCLAPLVRAVFRTIESLYEELVSEGIIVRPPKVSLSDYVGEYSFLGTTLRQANIEPMPSLSDVRRLVTEYTILPLGIYHTFVVLHSSLFTEKRWKLYSYNKACKRQT